MQSSIFGDGAISHGGKSQHCHMEREDTFVCAQAGCPECLEALLREQRADLPFDPAAGIPLTNQKFCSNINLRTGRRIVFLCLF
jgi:hypothetical protein